MTSNWVVPPFCLFLFPFWLDSLPPVTTIHPSQPTFSQLGSFFINQGLQSVWHINGVPFKKTNAHFKPVMFRSYIFTAPNILDSRRSLGMWDKLGPGNIDFSWNNIIFSEFSWMPIRVFQHPGMPDSEFRDWGLQDEIIPESRIARFRIPGLRIARWNNSRIQDCEIQNSRIEDCSQILGVWQRLGSCNIQGGSPRLAPLPPAL